MAAIEHALCARLVRSELFEPASAAVVRRGLRMLHDLPELPAVEALAHALGTSARQLRRTFSEVVGLSPKTYTRIVRFQRALRLARRPDAPSWSSIAAATGYFDQAHMSAEFRALAGTTPSALRTRS